MSDDDLIRRGDALNAVQGWTYCCNAEDAIAALPAVTAPQGVDDGRPCATDIFLVAAMDQLDDKWDFFEAVKDWCEGDWEGALEGVGLPAPAQPALTPKPVDDSLAADPAVKEWNAAIRAAAEAATYVILALLKEEPK